jgi:hypothetical protein
MLVVETKGVTLPESKNDPMVDKGRFSGRCWWMENYRWIRYSHRQLQP